MTERIVLATLLSLMAVRTVVAQPVADPDPARFQGEIDAFAAWDAKNTPPSGAVLFVGSSSIRMWPTADAFSGRVVINRGFGGAHISDVLAFFDRTVAPYGPTAIVFYCGDNDVADGKPPEQVLRDFDRFVERVRTAFGAVPIVYIAIKPSILRWELREPMQHVNATIASRAEKDPGIVFADIWSPMVATGSPPQAGLFLEDGLHMSPDGYLIWNRVIGAALETVGR